ncbi:GNAT family N-acetyltransferase [Evansella sp. AB-rgal1]|uniref:GNAT family N-acetyltransferase n=1 Tax=Evansella sp. AB-rgal1 TaxID=3242696 RepID=UPI00359ED1D0
MKVYKVEKATSVNIQIKITKLMMQQMDSISVNISEEELLHTIHLAMEPDSGSEFFVAEEKDEVVGCAFLNSGISLDKGGKYIWLNDLYVKRELRNKGIAKTILLKVLYWAEQEGFKGIELETGINNIATKKLYNSLGFYDIISKRYGRHI